MREKEAEVITRKREKGRKEIEAEAIIMTREIEDTKTKSETIASTKEGIVATRADAAAAGDIATSERDPLAVTEIGIEIEIETGIDILRRVIVRSDVIVAETTIRRPSSIIKWRRVTIVLITEDAAAAAATGRRQRNGPAADSIILSRE